VILQTAEVRLKGLPVPDAAAKAPCRALAGTGGGGLLKLLLVNAGRERARLPRGTGALTCRVRPPLSELGKVHPVVLQALPVRSKSGRLVP
jgi:hypothetical protein